MLYPDWSRTSTCNGYQIVYWPAHPKAMPHGYVLAHRIVVEEFVGRYLKPSEIVHHRNHKKRDNRIENLIILSRAAHARLHGADKSRATVELPCPNCQQPFRRERRQTHLVKGGERTFCSRRCSGQFSAKLVPRRNNQIS